MDWKRGWMPASLLLMLLLSGCVAAEPASILPTPTAATEPAATEPMVESGEQAPEVVEEVSLMPTPTAEPAAMIEEKVEAPSLLTAEQEAILAGLKNQGAAPELTNDTWINSQPLQLADLRGNVVIVEFWTYG